MSDFYGKLKTALANAGFFPEEEKLCKLVKYYEMLTEKNKVMNLTAITEEDEFIRKHFIDSLCITEYTAIGKKIRDGEKFRTIDVGTGAGFPGMVLKIIYPDLDMTLFDSLNKRLLFLEDVIRELGLEKIRTKHGRAEDLGHEKGYRQNYDLVLARAVANMSTLCEYCLPLTKINGTFVAYKSSELEEDLHKAEKAICILGGKLDERTEFLLPETNFKRTFAVIKKIKDTPVKYPRKAGTPSREPIL